MEIDVLNLLILSFIKLWFLLSLAICLLSRSRSTCASSLHALLLLVLLGTALLPLLVERIPSLHLLVLPADFRIEFYWSYGADLGSQIFTLLGSVYLLIVAWLWLRRFMQIRRVHALVRNAKALAVASHAELLKTLCSGLAIQSRVSLRYSDHIATPLTIGDIRPWILLPRESVLWDEHKLRRFLLHELAHIGRRDWFIKQFSYLIVAIFWIVPSAWRVLARLEWLAELSCDDVVIAAEGRRSDYAHDLLDVTASKAFAGAIGLIESRSHYERIAAVLDGGRIRRSNPLKFSLYALVFLLVLMMLASLQLAHVKRLENTADYELHPLILLNSAEQLLPNNTEQLLPDSAAQSSAKDLPDGEISHHLNPAADEPPLRFPLLALPDSTVKFKVTTTIDENWGGAAGDVIQPLVKMIPEYPRKALRRGREGVVEVTFNVLPTGETTQIHVLRAQPAGIFDKAAMDAVKQYRYAPQQREVHRLNEVFEFRLLEDAP